MYLDVSPQVLLGPGHQSERRRSRHEHAESHRHGSVCRRLSEGPLLRQKHLWVPQGERVFVSKVCGDRNPFERWQLGRWFVFFKLPSKVVLNGVTSKKIMANFIALVRLRKWKCLYLKVLWVTVAEALSHYFSHELHSSKMWVETSERASVKPVDL